MKKKIGISLCLISALILTVTGCGKKAELDDNKTAVSLKGIKITATDYYNEIKTSNISKLVDMIDHQLFDEKYKADDEENQAVKEQIDQLKESYSDETTFQSVIQQYFGVNSEEELEDMLHLEYKRNKAVEEFVADNLTDKEIEDYYDENIIGDIKIGSIKKVYKYWVGLLMSTKIPEKPIPVIEIIDSVKKITEDIITGYIKEVFDGKNET